MKRVLTLLAGIVVCIAGTGVSPLHAGWTIDGAPVFTRGGVESMPRICSDGAGGAIIVCIESSFYPPRIYAQRINELGRARWAVNGVQISFSENSTNRPRIAADGSGGAIIVWEDYYDSVTFDLYAQRVDSLGNLLWNPDGVPVSTAHDDQYWSEICTDGAGGCIIAWQDERTSTNSDIYAQRINASGNPVWTAGGIAICTADSIQWDVQIVPDGSGGAVMVWVDYRDIGDLYAQRVNAAGAAQWTANGAPVCLNTVINYEPKIASDGAGGAFVTWYDRRVTSFDAYLQRIDSSGNEVFTPGGIVLCNEAGSQRYPQIAADGAGGAIVVWEDFRDGSQVSYLYAHRVDASGTKLWSPASGVPIRHMSGHPYYPVIVSDEEEGAIISWADNRNIGGDNGYDVYAQRIDDTGTCLWRENGDSLCTAPGSQASLTAIVDGAGGMIVAWEDGREADTDIYAQLINGDGTFTACLLQSFAAAYGGAGIRIAWTIEEIPGSVEFFVLRRSIPDGRYEEVSNPAIDRDGCSFRFIDDGCESGRTYSYRIDVVDEAGRRTLFETDPITAPAAALRLFQNSPNPFNPSTVIGYHLPERCRVTLEIFDIAGRRIARLVDGVQGGGRHEVTWNGTGENGDRVDSGTYLYRLTAGKETISRKMILLR